MSVRSRVIMDDLISETTRKGVGHRVEIEVLTFLWEFAFGRERMMMPKYAGRAVRRPSIRRAGAARDVVVRVT